MNTINTLTTLRSAGAQVKLVKAVIKGLVEEARVLMSEDNLHAHKDIALEIGTDADTIQSYLHEFERIGVGRKGRFCVSSPARGK